MRADAAAPGEERPNPSRLFKRHLSPARRQLVELMQGVNFGRIERLRFVDGDPVLDPRPDIVREYKFGGENGPRPEIAADDYQLKHEVVDLLTFFDKHRSGVIESLDTRHGLPFRMIVRDVPV